MLAFRNLANLFGPERIEARRERLTVTGMPRGPQNCTWRGGDGSIPPAAPCLRVLLQPGRPAMLESVDYVTR
jgi:hypothetical protein